MADGRRVGGNSSKLIWTSGVTVERSAVDDDLSVVITLMLGWVVFRRGEVREHRHTEPWF
jgi:hypothetical protein